MESIVLTLSSVIVVTFLLLTVLKDRKDYFDYYNKD